MSILLALVSTPTPTPEIVKETLQTIVQPVAQTPAVVLQLAALVTTFGAGLVISLFHLTAKLKIKWLDGNVNRVLALVLGVGMGLTSAYAQGNLTWNQQGLVVAFVATAMSLFGQGTTFNVYKFLTSLTSVTTTVGTVITQELATEAASENPPVFPA